MLRVGELLAQGKSAPEIKHDIPTALHDLCARCPQRRYRRVERSTEKNSGVAVRVFGIFRRSEDGLHYRDGKRIRWTYYEESESRLVGIAR
jgi:hypothetical protein